MRRRIFSVCFGVKCVTKPWEAPLPNDYITGCHASLAMTEIHIISDISVPL